MSVPHASVVLLILSGERVWSWCVGDATGTTFSLPDALDMITANAAHVATVWYSADRPVVFRRDTGNWIADPCKGVAR